MIFGNWIAIHKGFTKYLPLDRSYTELEAIFSLSVDIDNKRSVSVAGYSKLWGWSRNKVNGFLSKVGVGFFYPKPLSKKQNQRAEAKGQIMDRSWTDHGQIRYIVDKGLQATKDRSWTDHGQIMDSTIDPNPNPNPKDKNLFAENSNEFRLAVFLENYILRNKPDFKKKDLQKWAKEFDYILRIDKRDLSETRELIKWCQTDPFWLTNIHSPSKFRKQYDQLKLKMDAKHLKENSSKSNASSTNDPPPGYWEQRTGPTRSIRFK